MNHKTPEAIAITDKAARELLVREKLLDACKLWIKYDQADENAFQLLMMNYANALNATKAAIKEAEALNGI